MRFGLLLAALVASAVNAPLPAAAGDIPCSAAQSLRSQNSAQPTQMTFVNRTGEGRAILWIGFDGRTKQYAYLNPGQSFLVNTFVTHPWMVTNGPGDCIDIYMPRSTPRTVRLTAHTSMGGPAGGGPTLMPQPPAIPTQQPATNAGPSFDCRRASLPAEQAICADPELAQWDERMAQAYAGMMRQLPPGRQNQLAQDQNAWLQQRNQCGASVNCLMSAYLDRVAYINEYMAGDAGPGAGPGADGAFPIQARSWGGKVRSGPGANFAAIASLQEREPITLLEQSDAPLFQNFPWFKIQFRGRIGYQWGGIICGIDAPIPGAFQTCN